MSSLSPNRPAADHRSRPRSHHEDWQVLALQCPACGGALVASARQETWTAGVETPVECERCHRRFAIRIREHAPRDHHCNEHTLPLGDREQRPAEPAQPSRPQSAPPRGMGLAARRAAIDLQRLVFPLGNCAGGLLMLGLGGFIPVLTRWLRDDTRLSLPAIVEALGGAWPMTSQADPDLNLGPPLQRQDAPLLFDAIDHVARRLGARVPPRVRLTFLPCCGVVACGRRERALLIGLPLLGVLNRRELIAVLAHELSHWARGDASRAERTNQFVARLGQRLDEIEAADSPLTRWSPLHWWARWHFRVAARLRAPIVLGQESRADRAAAALAGGDYAASALVKVALVQPLFREVLAHFEAQPEESTNIYAFFRAFWRRLPDELLMRLRHGLLSPNGTPQDDAHPCLLDRLALVQAYSARMHPTDRLPAADLLADIEAWEDVLHSRLFSAPRIEASVFHLAGR